MPVLMQVCLVIVTLAVVTIAALAVAISVRLQKGVQQITTGVGSLRQALDEVNRASAEARTVLMRIEEIIRDVRSVSERFERVGKSMVSG